MAASPASRTHEPDAIIVGAGLSGLVAAAELVDAGKRVVIVEQEPEASLGGQAHWSFGGLFLIDSPEQRRMGVKDSLELAKQDWDGTAGFDRDEDEWGRRWADAYLEFAAGEKRAWLHEKGVRFFPIVGWAERGGYNAIGHGNSVPRFHITWGTGPGVLAPFIARVQAGAAAGLVEFRHRHRVDELIVESGAVVGVRGAVLAADAAGRGEPSNRDVVGDFELRAPAVVVASGGIGGNHELVREFWPERMGAAAEAHALGRARARRRPHARRSPSGRAPASSTATGCGTTPRASRTGTRSGRCTASGSCPDRRRCGSTPTGKRLPVPLFPGFDTLGTLEHIVADRPRPLAGSCSRRRSSRRSSRSRAASRTPTSPART